VPISQHSSRFKPGPATVTPMRRGIREGTCRSKPGCASGVAPSGVIMKTLLATWIALSGLAIAALGESWIDVDNSSAVGGVALNTAGNYYTGTFGVEIWALPGTSVPGDINSFNGAPGGAPSAYANLTADGYQLAGTFANKSMTIPGAIVNVGIAMAPNVSSGNNVVAVVLWNNSGTSFNAMLASATANTRAGVYTFVNGFDVPPGYLTTLGDGWGSSDLVMTTVPEPNWTGLILVAAGSLLVCRRGKHPQKRINHLVGEQQIKKAVLTILSVGLATNIYAQGQVILYNVENTSTDSFASANGLFWLSTGGTPVLINQDFNAAFYAGTDSSSLPLIATYFLSDGTAINDNAYGPGTIADLTLKQYAIPGAFLSAFF
jgi:hypothetical protein